jgi:hypothetical protein
MSVTKIQINSTKMTEKAENATNPFPEVTSSSSPSSHRRRPTLLDVLLRAPNISAETAVELHPWSSVLRLERSSDRRIARAAS